MKISHPSGYGNCLGHPSKLCEHNLRSGLTHRKTSPGIGIFSFQGPMGRWVQIYCDATFSSRLKRWPFGSTSRQCQPPLPLNKVSLEEVLYLSIWPHKVYIKVPMGIIACPKMICFWYNQTSINYKHLLMSRATWTPLWLQVKIHNLWLFHS